MLSQLTELRTFCKMAVENDAEATQAFPNPPLILYRLYTDENVASGVAPKPPVPVKGNYQMFGALFNVRYALTPLTQLDIHNDLLTNMTGWVSR